jgi:hypothetical protein
MQKQSQQLYYTHTTTKHNFCQHLMCLCAIQKVPDPKRNTPELGKKLSEYIGKGFPSRSVCNHVVVS